MQAGGDPGVTALAEGGEVVADLGQPLVEGLVGAVEVLRQPGEMQVGTVVENGRTGGDTDRPAQVTHQVEQPRCMFEPVSYTHLTLPTSDLV